MITCRVAWANKNHTSAAYISRQTFTFTNKGHIVLLHNIKVIYYRLSSISLSLEIQFLHNNRDWNNHGCVVTSSFRFTSAMEHFSGRQQWGNAECLLHIKISIVRRSSHYQQPRQHLRSVQHIVPAQPATPLLHCHPLPSPSPQWDPAETLQ